MALAKSYSTRCRTAHCLRSFPDVNSRTRRAKPQSVENVSQPHVRGASTQADVQELSQKAYKKQMFHQAESTFQVLTNEFQSAMSNRLQGRRFDSERSKHDILQELVPQTRDLGGVPRLESVERATFFASGEAVGYSRTDIEMQVIDVEIGSLVELRRNNITQNAVVMDYILVADQHYLMSLTSNGEYWKHRITDVCFKVPGFIDRETVIACGNQLQPVNTFQRRSRLGVLKRMRDFEREVERTFAAMGRAVNRLYPILASTNVNAWSQVTTMQALSLVDDRASPPVTTILAMHRHLMMRSDQFLADPWMHRVTHTFDVRPRQIVEDLAMIREYLMDKSPHLTEFSTKCQQIIKFSRQARADSGDCTPQLLDTAGLPTFSDTDKLIIRVLKASVRNARSTQSDQITSYAAMIVKETALYPSTIYIDTIHVFLREIGVYAPWNDPHLDDAEGPLVRTTALDSQLAAQSEEALEKSLQQIRSERTSSEHGMSQPKALAIDEFYPRDVVGAVRHDFGDMSVLVIDDHYAEELDDGISFEELPNGDILLHVHVADPTLYLHPNHAISQRASSQLESHYQAQRSNPLLPRRLTELVHLGASKGAERGVNVLTLTVKVTPDGDLCDYQFRAGIVHNLHILRYDDVDAALGFERFNRHPFGRFAGATPNAGAIPKALLPQLLALHKFSTKLANQRSALGIIMPLYEAPRLVLSPRPLPNVPVGTTSPVLYKGFPTIDYSIERSDGYGARGVVAECMKVACRAASRWFTDHKVPALRKSLLPFSSPIPGAMERLREKARRGEGSTELELRMAGNVHQTTVYSLEPKSHAFMTVTEGEGYTRMTSPLRRYLDLIHHWQIKHILSGGSADTVPFSAKYLSERMGFFTAREKGMRRLENRQVTYWNISFIRNWIEKQDPEQCKEPLANLECQVHDTATWNNISRYYVTTMWCPKLAVYGVLLTPRTHDIPLGTVLRCKIKVTTQHMGPVIEFMTV